jgi:hypothetical protein
MIAQLSRIGAVSALVAALGGCATTTGGAPVQTPVAGSATASSTTSTTASTSTTTSAPATSELPPFGVLETTKVPVTPGELTCGPDPAPAGALDVTGSAAGSPTVLFAVPEGFTATGPAGAAALSLTGPDAMTATVTIAPTTLAAGPAFAQHADALTGSSDISSISLLPGELCGYSGQEMMGSLGDGAGTAVEFADRVVHVWTAAGDFLITVHLQAPSGAAGFDGARSALFADFGIRMP